MNEESDDYNPVLLDMWKVATQEQAENDRRVLGEAAALPSFPDGLPRQLEDRGSDTWCSRHGRIPWAMDGICNGCECEGDAEVSR